MILLTGSTGMIGQNIKEQWGGTILCPPRDYLDLRNTEHVNSFLREQSPEMIIHCGSNDNDICLADNIQMFYNLADSKIPMITFCTGREMEDRAYKNPEYVISKRIIKELSLNAYSHITVIQLWGCFGKHERNIRFFMSNIKRVKEGKDIYVGEDKMFSYVWVNDLIKIMKTIIPGQGQRLIRPVAYTLLLSEYAKHLSNVMGLNKIDIEKEAFSKSYIGKNNVDFPYTKIHNAIRQMVSDYE